MKKNIEYFTNNLFIICNLAIYQFKSWLSRLTLIAIYYPFNMAQFFIKSLLLYAKHWAW